MINLPKTCKSELPQVCVCSRLSGLIIVELDVEVVIRHKWIWQYQCSVTWFLIMQHHLSCPPRPRLSTSWCRLEPGNKSTNQLCQRGKNKICASCYYHILFGIYQYPMLCHSHLPPETKPAEPNKQRKIEREREGGKRPPDDTPSGLSISQPHTKAYAHTHAHAFKHTITELKDRPLAAVIQHNTKAHHLLRL